MNNTPLPAPAPSLPANIDDIMATTLQMPTLQTPPFMRAAISLAILDQFNTTSKAN
jgi:hypothetical protein